MIGSQPKPHSDGQRRVGAQHHAARRQPGLELVREPVHGRALVAGALELLRQAEVLQA